MVRLILLLSLIFSFGCNYKSIPKVYSESKNPPYSAYKECEKLCNEKYHTQIIGAESDGNDNLTNCYCK